MVKKVKHYSNNSANKEAYNNDGKVNNDSNTDTQLKEFLVFDDFSSTKNKNHVSSDCNYVFISSKVKVKCRQYMNRRHGFNKPLEKMN